MGQYGVSYLHYGRYGKEGIKKMKTSPDGWCVWPEKRAFDLH